MESGIWRGRIQNSAAGIWNQQRGIQNLTLSRITLDGAIIKVEMLRAQ